MGFFLSDISFKSCKYRKFPKYSDTQKNVL